MMNRKAAMLVLGVFEGYTENDVRSAYSRALKLAHPDTAGGADERGNVSRAKDAKDFLLTLLANKCASCKGSGAVGGFVCKACKGRG